MWPLASDAYLGRDGSSTSRLVSLQITEDCEFVCVDTSHKIVKDCVVAQQPSTSIEIKTYTANVKDMVLGLSISI